MATEGTTEQVNAGGTGSDSAAGTTGATGTTGTSSSQASGTGQAATTGFTYQEDRGKWIPPHRLTEESSKRQSLETRAAQLEAELKSERARVQALAGVTPQDPNAEKSEQIKAAFFQMFPQFKHLASLNDEQMQQLLRAPEGLSAAQSIEQREWQRHGKAQLTNLYSQVADAMGAESLNDDQQSDLRESFKSWLTGKCKSELQASNGAESETQSRYEAGDPKLIEEFAKRYTNNWVEPARRRVTAQTLTRTRNVPNSTGRSQVTSVNKVPAFKNLDERIDYAAKQRFGS